MRRGMRYVGKERVLVDAGCQNVDEKALVVFLPRSRLSHSFDMPNLGAVYSRCAISLHLNASVRQSPVLSEA